MPASRKSTRQLLSKIPGVLHLYRHSVNQSYYGVKKLGGKRKEHSLGTTDRKLAERRLKEWLENLGRVAPESHDLTMASLVERFRAMTRDKAPKTRATNESILRRFSETWKPGLTTRVAEVRPSHLDEWLAAQGTRFKNSTYNRYVGLLRQLFDIAVRDRVIAESPVVHLATRWKRPQKPFRVVPTLEEFQAIVADVRAQHFSAHATETADFIEFLGLAGVGQAEAAAVTWGEVLWEQNRIVFRRRKTQALYYVPIYNHLRPFLERLRRECVEAPRPGDRILKVQDAKRALSAACVRLGFKRFSQRSIRAVLIRRLWQSGVDVKLIAKWQGHQDGGKLILDTYTEVFGSKDAEYERAQLARVA